MDAAGLLRLELIDTWMPSARFLVLGGSIASGFRSVRQSTEDKERDASVNDSFAQVRPGDSHRVCNEGLCFVQGSKGSAVDPRPSLANRGIVRRGIEACSATFAAGSRGVFAQALRAEGFAVWSLALTEDSQPLEATLRAERLRIPSLYSL